MTTVYRKSRKALFVLSAEEWKAQPAIVEFEKAQREQESLIAEGKRVRAARVMGGKKAAKQRRKVLAARDEKIRHRAVKALNRSETNRRNVTRYLIDTEQAEGLSASRLRIILKKAGV